MAKLQSLNLLFILFCTLLNQEASRWLHGLVFVQILVNLISNHLYLVHHARP